MNSYEEYVETKQSNTLGVVGFVLSVTCCLAPLGFLLSLIAVFKPPRGFAIAGLLIGGLITALFVNGYMQMDELAKKGKFDSVGSSMEYFIEFSMVAQSVQQTSLTKGALPTSIDELVLEDPFGTEPKIDPWGKPYRLRDTGQRREMAQQGGGRALTAFFALESPGVDGEWGTDDDILPESWEGGQEGAFLVPCPVPGSAAKDEIEEQPPEDEEATDPAQPEDDEEGR
jgi:hypothetical protein